MMKEGCAWRWGGGGQAWPGDFLGRACPEGIREVKARSMSEAADIDDIDEGRSPLGGALRLLQVRLKPQRHAALVLEREVHVARVAVDQAVGQARHNVLQAPGIERKGSLD